MEEIKRTEINRFGLPNIVLPAEVIFHPDLTPREKILFGVINNLAHTKDGCWASNRYLAKLIGVRPDTTSTAIAKLAEHKFIFLEYHTRPSDGNIIRRIYINKEYPIIHSNILEKAFKELTELTELPEEQIEVKTKIGRPKTYTKPSENKYEKSQNPICEISKRDLENSKRVLGKVQSKLDKEIDNKLDKKIDNNIPNMDSKDIYNINTINNNIPGINISKTHKCVLDTKENEKNSFIKNGDNTSSIIKEKETGIGSIKERIVNSSIKQKNTISAKIRNKKYLPLAEKLSAIICEAKNVRHSKKQINAWADPIRKLVETNGVDYSRVEKVLDWYKENIDGEFIPRIETGYALRQKFIALEDAMKRQNTVKQPKQFTNSLPPEPGEYDWVDEIARKNMQERIERAGETGFFAQARKRMLEGE